MVSLERMDVEPEEAEMALEALGYVILHIMKHNASARPEFDAIFE